MEMSNRAMEGCKIMATNKEDNEHYETMVSNAEDNDGYFVVNRSRSLKILLDHPLPVGGVNKDQDTHYTYVPVKKNTYQ